VLAASGLHRLNWQCACVSNRCRKRPPRMLFIGIASIFGRRSQRRSCCSSIPHVADELLDAAGARASRTARDRTPSCVGWPTGSAAAIHRVAPRNRAARTCDPSRDDRPGAGLTIPDRRSRCPPAGRTRRLHTTRRRRPDDRRAHGREAPADSAGRGDHLIANRGRPARSTRPTATFPRNAPSMIRYLVVTV